MGLYTSHIVDAIKSHGDSATLKEIYKYVLMHLEKDKQFIPERLDAIIRREIQESCSKTKAFKDTNDDLFIPTDKLGSGIWSLKDPTAINYKKVATQQESDLEAFFTYHMEFDGVSEKNLRYQQIMSSMNSSMRKRGGEIDVIVKHGDYTFICECKSGKNAKNEFHKWLDNNSKHTSYLMSDKIYSKHKDFKITDKSKVIYIYDVYRQPKAYDYCKNIIENDTSGAYKNCFVWNRDIQNYYKDEAKLTDTSISRNWLLKYCGIDSPTESLEVPATRIKYSNGSKSFLFTVDPKKFVEFAYVARRTPEHSSNNYYQRLLKGSRLNEIASTYLEDEKGYFPNSIIVNIQDEKSFKFKKSKDSPLLDDADYGILSLNKRCICFIIDGQHRLFSYLKTKNSGKIVVNALQTSKEEEAKLFVAINDKQSKVPPNLIWDLIGIMQPETDKGVISNTVRYMNSNPKSFFYQKVKFSTSRKKNMVNLSGLCRGIDERKSLLGNQYISSSSKKSIFYLDKQDFDYQLHEKLGDIISSYFENLNKFLGEEFSDEYFAKEYLYYINLKLCFMLIEHYIVNTRSFPSQITNDFFKDLSDIIKNTDYMAAGGKALSSYGQYSNLLKRYIFKLRKAGYENFAPNTKIEVDKQLDKQIARIEKNIHRLSIIFWEKHIGKNYLDKLHSKGQVGTAYHRSELDDKHPEFLIASKSSLSKLLKEKTIDKELEKSEMIRIIEPGDSNFARNEIANKDDYKKVLSDLRNNGRGVNLPKASNEITYFEKYLEKYLLAKHKKGGLITQYHEIWSFFESIYTYRSNMDTVHDADREIDIDELFHDTTLKAYKNMAEILDISFKNAWTEIKKEYK